MPTILRLPQTLVWLAILGLCGLCILMMQALRSPSADEDELQASSRRFPSSAHSKRMAALQIELTPPLTLEEITRDVPGQAAVRLPLGPKDAPIFRAIRYLIYYDKDNLIVTMWRRPTKTNLETPGLTGARFEVDGVFLDSSLVQEKEDGVYSLTLPALRRIGSAKSVTIIGPESNDSYRLSDEERMGASKLAVLIEKLRAVR